MDYHASHRHARISPRKVRPLADLVRGRHVEEALAVLQFKPHRGAKMLAKVIRSAMGNAVDPENKKNKGRPADPKKLVVAEACVDSGPMFKRFRPRARGMAFTIKKRMSHIRVTLKPEDELR